MRVVLFLGYAFQISASLIRISISESRSQYQVGRQEPKYCTGNLYGVVHHKCLHALQISASATKLTAYWGLTYTVALGKIGVSSKGL
jgi:hypothetical protein